jgi:hypothetical protein
VFLRRLPQHQAAPNLYLTMTNKVQPGNQGAQIARRLATSNVAHFYFFWTNKDMDTK